ncbi:PREDICTED: putative protein TPRXL, partial [Rhagoletis zephyria]|uniref:putative protein TPRXL n=1 Tax=Rhagoletis zephyria TaxID=28612 RepID=UPI00081157A3
VSVLVYVSQRALPEALYCRSSSTTCSRSVPSSLSPQFRTASHWRAIHQQTAVLTVPNQFSNQRIESDGQQPPQPAPSESPSAATTEPSTESAAPEPPESAPSPEHPPPPPGQCDLCQDRRPPPLHSSHCSRTPSTAAPAPESSSAINRNRCNEQQQQQHQWRRSAEQRQRKRQQQQT